MGFGVGRFCVDKIAVNQSCRKQQKFVLFKLFHVVECDGETWVELVGQNLPVNAVHPSKFLAPSYMSYRGKFGSKNDQNKILKL